MSPDDVLAKVRAEVPAFAKRLFAEVPGCTGCDFDHGWDDHVLAVWDALEAALEAASGTEPPPFVHPRLGVAALREQSEVPTIFEGTLG
jgi:hypothetical protein